jgi:TonB family protein
MPSPTSSILLSIALLYCPVVVPSCWAKAHEPGRIVTLEGDRVSTILGASRELHEMKSLGHFGAPTEYVNRDLERLTVNEGPCIYVAGPVKLDPPAAYAVAIECFDLVTEKEIKSFAYATDSDGKMVIDGKKAKIGEYGKDDPHFDLAAWQWISAHISPALEKKIAADRATGVSAISETQYKVDMTGDHGGPKVSAPIITRAVNQNPSEDALRYRISGVSVVSIVIDTDGLPRKIRTVVPVGYGLDEEAVKAVAQCQFQPSKLNGKPVPVSITIEMKCCLP